MYSYKDKNEDKDVEILIDLQNSTPKQSYIPIPSGYNDDILRLFNIEYKYNEDKGVYEFDDPYKCSIVFNGEKEDCEIRRKKDKYQKEIQFKYETGSGIAKTIRDFSKDGKTLNDYYQVKFSKCEDDVVFEIIINDIYFNDSSSLPNISKKQIDTSSDLIKVTELFDYLKEPMIPLFQRNYVWEKKNIETLIEDIKEISKTEKKHYLGEVICIGNMIIDGQQRITTLGFILYLCGIIDIKKLFFIPTVKNNSDKFENVKNSPRCSDGIKTKHLLNFEYVKGAIGSDINFSKNLQDTLINVTILSNEEFDAPTVYNSINTTGVSLTQYELIKTILFNTETMESKEAKELNDYFNELGRNNKKGNSEVYTLDDLFRYYCCIKTGKLPTKDEKSAKGKSISEEYKTYIVEEYGNKFDIEDLEKEKLEIKKWFNLLQEVIKNPEKLQLDEITRLRIRWLINVQSEVIPLIAVIYYVKDESKIDILIKDLVSVVIRVLLCNKDVKSYIFDKISNSTYKQIKENRIVLDDFYDILNNSKMVLEDINNDDLKYGKIDNNDRSKHILALYNSIEQPDEMCVDSSNIHTEHIFPRQPEGDVLADERYINYRDWVETLGNKTLLEEKPNKTYSNRNYKEKKKTYECSKFKITNDIMEEDFKGKDYIDPEDVAKRTNKIIDALLEKYPKQF